MNDITTTLALDQDRLERLADARHDRRLTPAERISLRLGLWLLLRGERRLDRAQRALQAGDLAVARIEAARAEVVRAQAFADAHLFGGWRR